jgi:hypothetical protein
MVVLLFGFRNKRWCVSSPFVKFFNILVDLALVVYKIGILRFFSFVIFLQCLYVIIVLDKKFIDIFLGFTEFWNLSSFPGLLKQF